MNSDKKIEMVKRIVNGEESPQTIVGSLHFGPQLIGFTEAGRSHVNELFDSGSLSNSLKDCTIIVKIEDRKAQVSVVHNGITIFEFKPVDPGFSITTFEFPGVSIPLKMGW